MYVDSRTPLDMIVSGGIADLVDHVAVNDQGVAVITTRDQSKSRHPLNPVNLVSFGLAGALQHTCTIQGEKLIVNGADYTMPDHTRNGQATVIDRKDKTTLFRITRGSQNRRVVYIHPTDNTIGIYSGADVLKAYVASFERDARNRERFKRMMSSE